MLPTREHGRIREWAEKHDAKPAQLRRLKYDGQPAVLTFVFGATSDMGPDITLISWDMFFAEFTLLGLAMTWHGNAPLFDIVKVDDSFEGNPAEA